MGILLTRTRYRCQECGQTFLQQLTEVDDGKQMTSRLRRRNLEMKMNATQKIRLADDSIVDARYSRHSGTHTAGSGSDNIDEDVYITSDGREVVCLSPANDCRVMPRDRRQGELLDDESR